MGWEEEKKREGGDEKGLLRRDSQDVFDHSFYFLRFSVRFQILRIQFRFKQILIIILYPNSTEISAWNLTKCAA